MRQYLSWDPIQVIHANRVQTYVDFPLINKRQFLEVSREAFEFIDSVFIDVIAGVASNVAVCNYDCNADGYQYIFPVERIPRDKEYYEAFGQKVSEKSLF